MNLFSLGIAWARGEEIHVFSLRIRIFVRDEKEEEGTHTTQRRVLERS